MKSIRYRLTAGMFFWLFFLLGIGGGGLYLLTRVILLSEFDSALRAQALALVTLVKEDRGRIELDFSDDLMPSFSQKENPEYFQLCRENGPTLESSSSLGSGVLPFPAGVSGHGPFPLQSPTFWNLDLPDGRPGRAIGIQFVPENQESNDERDDSGQNEGQHSYDPARVEITPLVLVVAKGRAELDHALHVLAISLLIVGALIFMGTAAVIPVVIGRGLAPLAQVAEQATRIDAASLASRFPMASVPAELEPICGRLNDLLERLEAAFARERRFTADVAHELRTPIAELRALSEVAIKWPEDSANTAVARAFEDAHEISLQMEGIVTALLDITRSESGRQAIKREPIRLAEFCDRIMRPLMEFERARNLGVAVEIDPGIIIATDHAMLRSILRNVFVNAFDYTPPEGRIEVRGESRGDKFTLTVSNTNPGLTEEDVQHIFEPFWRKDPARSNSAHSGLGLKVAAEFARTLSFELNADLPQEEADTFRITLKGAVGKSSIVNHQS